jgi:hypothetical protein
MVDGLTEPPFEAGQFHVVEFAQEHAELHVVAVAHEGLEDGGPPLVVGNIIRDEVAISHGFLA